MEWVKLSTQFYNDPAFDDLTPNAERLFVRCLAFAGAVGTGGVLTQKQIKKVGILNSNRYVSELVLSGLWVQTESGDFRIRSWDAWQESADELEQRRRADRERKRREREMSRDRSRDVQPLEKRREEERRVDTPKGVSTEASEPAPTSISQPAPIPDDWQPSDNTRRWAEMRYSNVVDIDDEVTKFVCHALDKGRRTDNPDAAFMRWLVNAKQFAERDAARMAGRGPRGSRGNSAPPPRNWMDVARDLEGPQGHIDAEVIELREIG